MCTHYTTICISAVSDKASVALMYLSLLTSWVQRKFPGTPTVSTGDLQDRLREGGDAVLLLDAREPEEFKVSRIEGAQHLKFSSSEEEVKSKLKELVKG